MPVVLQRCSFTPPLVLLWFPYDNSEMVRSGFEKGSKVIKITSLTDEGLYTDRNRQRTYLAE